MEDKIIAWVCCSMSTSARVVLIEVNARLTDQAQVNELILCLETVKPLFEAAAALEG